MLSDVVYNKWQSACYHMYCTKNVSVHVIRLLYQEWQCARCQMYCINSGSMPVITCTLLTMEVCMLSDVLYNNGSVHVIRCSVRITAVHVIRCGVPTVVVCLLMLSDVLCQHWQCTCYRMSCTYQWYCTNSVSAQVTRCTVPTCYWMYCSNMLPDVMYQHVTRCTAATCYQI